MSSYVNGFAFRPSVCGAADVSTDMIDVQNETDPLTSAGPVLSAVVFAYRNEATVLRAVSSLVQQDFEEPFEVIVATSGGDRTAELVRRNFPDVRVVESPVRMMPGGARNLGMKLASGEIIAFLEADCFARQGWIKNRVVAHRAGHEAVASAVAVANPHRSAARATAYLCYDNRLEGSPEGPCGTTTFLWSLVYARTLEPSRPVRRGPPNRRGHAYGGAPPRVGGQRLV